MITPNELVRDVKPIDALPWMMPVPMAGNYFARQCGTIYKVAKDRQVKRVNVRWYKGYMCFGANTTVHSAVCSAFYGKRPQGMLCCHYDDNKENNKVTNLRWATHQDNVQDAIRNKKMVSQKLSEFDVHNICAMICAQKLTLQEIAKKYNVGTGLINDIRHGKAWKHVVKDYDFPDRYGAHLITDDDAYKICELLASKKIPCDEISRQVGFSTGAIRFVKKSKRWKHISDQFDLSETYSVKVCDDDDVHAICRALVENKMKMIEIAEKHGISKTTVIDIKNGKSCYRHISDQYDFSNYKKVVPKGAKASGARLTENDVRKIKSLLRDGATQRSLSKQFGVSESAIYKIKYGKSWGDIE